MFGGRTSLKGEVLVLAKGVYRKLSESIGQKPEEFHYDYFEIREGRLYSEDMNMPLMTKYGILKSAGETMTMLGKNRLRKLGFDVTRCKVTARQAVMLNKAEEEMSSRSDVAKADDIELQEIMENVARSTGNLIVQLEGESSEDLPMYELLGLDKQLRSIRGSLTVEVAKKVQLEEKII